MEANANTPYLSHDGSSSRIRQDLADYSKRKKSSAGQKAEPQAEDMLGRAAAMSKQISVGIVGAGFAGLRCADVLLRRGFKVTIFEARNRLGGRVGQSCHLGHAVDLGPNWIHGTDDNPIMQLARETNTTLHTWDESQSIIDSDGQPLNPAEAEEYGRILWDDGLIAAAFKHSNENCKSIPAEQSLYDFFEEKSKELFANLPEEEAERKRSTLLKTASMWGAYVGSDVRRQSLKFFWLEECIEGENPFVAGTYEKILNAVAKTARERANIRLETKVVRVRSHEEDANGKRSNLHIETADGGKHDFDETVCTMPLGWLKRNHSEAFEPALPPRLVKAIDSIGYGTLDKVYITFPISFWNSPNSTTKHPGFTHWLAPAYAPSINPAGWDQQSANLSSLPASTAHPTLLFYIYGSCATHIASLVSDTSIAATERDKILIEWFKPYFSRLPNYEASVSNCHPTGILATAWANDEFAGHGSYANFQIRLEEGDRCVEIMREGLPERGIWLAGEHTAPFVALGTSTGAYWSGEGVGLRIAEKYGK